jgi:hypothetical protein
VEGDQAQGGTLALPPGVDYESIVERRLLACSAPQGGPELLLTEGNRVIRYHRLSRWCRGLVPSIAARDVPIEAGTTVGG